MALHVDLEQLLQHREFLKALARGLVADPMEQEELLWETMGEGAMRPPRHAALKPWLARVMRNQAKARQRAKLRRLVHEHAGAKPGQTESAAELAARFELFHVLVSHVQDLEPKYREVVLFRFFENLPPREIAERMDLPIETVKTRLLRALAILRARLDREHGSRDKWLGCLLPLAFPGGKAAGMGILTFGGLLMSMKSKVALFGCVALLLLGVGKMMIDREAQPAFETEEPPVLASVPARTPLGEGPGKAEVERQVIAPRAIGRSVRCLVFLGFDKSYSGARVRMELFPGNEPIGEPEHSETVSADTDGWAVWPLPKMAVPNTQANAVPIWVVRVSSADTRVGGGAQTAFVIQDQTRDVHVILRLFPLDHEFHGTVEDGQGHPISGAHISVAIVGGKARSDAQGQFSIRTSSAFPDGMYMAIAEGYGSTRGNARLMGPGRTKLRIILEPGYRILGRVTDTEGRGLSGARVTADQTMGLFVVTDSDGNYEITNAQRGSEKPRVSAEMAGFASGSCTVAGSKAEGRGDMTLHGGGQIKGQVLDPLGRGVIGARVTAGSRNPSNRRHRVVSHADGSFTLRDLRTGKHSLRVHRQGFAPGHLSVLVTTGQISDLVTVTLRPGKPVAGTVTDKAGRPAKNIEVIPKGNHHYYLERMTTTDSAGRYRLEDLPDAVDAVDLLGVGFVPLTSQPVVLGNEHADFRLTRTVKLRGRVLDSRTGAPIPKFRIRILSFKGPERLTMGPTWGNQGVRFQTEDGTWESAREQIPNGMEFRLEARATGFAPERVEKVIATPDMVPVVFRMSGGTRLGGQVLDADSGKPAARVEVELLRVEKLDRTAKRPLSLSSSRASPRNLTITGADGRFSFECLPRAEFHALVRRDGHLVHIEGPTTPGAGGLTIWLQQPVTLSGRLLDWKDQAIPNAKVLARRVFETQEDRASRYSSTKTDTEGRFAIDKLIRGAYVISSSGKNSAGATVVFRQTLTLGIENEARGDLRPIGRSSVSGTVQLAPGAELVSVRITVTTPTGARHVFSTEVSDGNFAVLGLPPGECRLAVSYNLKGRRRKVDHPVPVVLRDRQPATVQLNTNR